MVKYGRRNIACLTIAPTGTTSIMTQTTSGIEPVFMPVYTRRRKVNPNDKNVTVDFTDENGDSWEEYIVFHHKFATWMEVNNIPTAKKYTKEEIDELIAKSPYYKATSNDVDWLKKVQMQGRVQKWVDHSISVTINLPSDVSEELVGNYTKKPGEVAVRVLLFIETARVPVFFLQLTTKEEKDDEKEIRICYDIGDPLVRPKKLKCDIVRFKITKTNGLLLWD